jgi:HEAT repeat protein
LYRVFILDKNITSIPSAQFQLIDAFVDLVTTPHTEETEKERSSLIEALKKFLNKYGSEGFELLKTYIEILLKSEQETLISDILEIIGESENPDSKNDRRIYLEDQLIKNKKQKIRYGALLGLENIESQQSIPALRQALRDEDVPVLRELIHEILRLLR